MEILHYLRLIRKHWLIFSIGLIVTSGGGVLAAQSQPEVYESRGTYVVRPASADDSDVVRAFDTLIRGVEINATYAAIARSDVIRDRAAAAVDPATEASVQSIKAEPITGTNIIEIAVQADDPEAAAAMADRVGAETVEYITELRDVFRLQQLDPPLVPSAPASGNQRLNIALSVIAGVVIGGVLAIAAEAFRGRQRPFPELNIIDRDTGLYNVDYFKLRLADEIEFRTDANGKDPGVAVTKASPKSKRRSDPTPSPSRKAPPLSLGVVTVGVGVSGAPPSPAEIRMLSQSISDDLRPTDVVAYLGNGSLAAILPGMAHDKAKIHAIHWSRQMARTVQNNGSRRLSFTGTTCHFAEDEFIGDEHAVALVSEIMSSTEDFDARRASAS